MHCERVTEVWLVWVVTPNGGCSVMCLCPWVHKDRIKGMTGAVLLLEYFFSSASNYTWIRCCVKKLDKSSFLISVALSTWGRLPARVTCPRAVWWELVRFDSVHLLYVCAVKWSSRGKLHLWTGTAGLMTLAVVDVNLHEFLSSMHTLESFIHNSRHFRCSVGERTSLLCCAPG